MITHIPFVPRIRIEGEDFATELLENIEKMAKYYKKDIKDFSASFELIVDPESIDGYFLISQVTYNGDLKVI